MRRLLPANAMRRAGKNAHIQHPKAKPVPINRAKFHKTATIIKSLITDFTSIQFVTSVGFVIGVNMFVSSIKFFNQTAACITLFPQEVTILKQQKLRKPTVYDIPFARTNKFKNSFILYALNNYI